MCIRDRCEPATAADAEIAQDLVDTLLSIEDAACLAANQIGVTKACLLYTSCRTGCVLEDLAKDPGRSTGRWRCVAGASKNGETLGAAV